MKIQFSAVMLVVQDHCSVLPLLLFSIAIGYLKLLQLVSENNNELQTTLEKLRVVLGKQ